MKYITLSPELRVIYGDVVVYWGDSCLGYWGLGGRACL